MGSAQVQVLPACSCQTPGVPVTTCQHEFPVSATIAQWHSCYFGLLHYLFILSILASCPVPREGSTDTSNERINSVICKRQGGKRDFIARCFPAACTARALLSCPLHSLRSSHPTPRTHFTLPHLGAFALTAPSVWKRSPSRLCLAGSSLPRSLLRRHLCQAASPGHSA